MKQLYLAVLAFFMFASIAVASTTIEHAQIMLNELGYDAGPADGISGPRTENAFRKFLSDRDQSSKLIGFAEMERLYDAYVTATNKNVFDIMGEGESDLAQHVKAFPATPFGDIELLRQAAEDYPSVKTLNKCPGTGYPQAAISANIGTLMGFIKPETTRAFQTVAVNPTNWSSDGMTARGTYTEHVQTLAMDILLNDRKESKEKLTQILLQYAEADAFQWYSGSREGLVFYNDTYGLKSVFTPTIAGWSTIRHERETDDRQSVDSIDAWLWRVINRVDYFHNNDPNLDSNRNNQRYMLMLNLLQLGLLYKSEYFVHRSLVDARKIASEQRPDGSLPLETSREHLSLHYTGHATVSLMAVAEYMSLLGLNLYESSETNFRPVFEFHAAAEINRQLIESYAGHKQTGLSQENVSAWTYGGLTQFCTRYPETEGCVTRIGITTYPKSLPYLHLPLNMGNDGMMNACISGLMDVSGAKH